MDRRCQDLGRQIQKLNQGQEIFQDAIEGKLSVQDRASERMQNRIIEETKELGSTKTEEALQIAGKSMTCGCTKWQGVRKLRQDEEIAWAPPKKMTKWPEWEEARKLESGEWRLEPEGEAEVPEIIIVSDAVEGTPVDVEGESRHEQVEAKLSRRERECSVRARRSEVRKGSDSSGIRRNTRLCKKRFSEFEEEKRRTFIPSAVAFR